MARGFDGRFNISKTVGWDPRPVFWPSISDAHEAIQRKDAVQICIWLRFLPSPINDNQRTIINRLFDAYPEIRDAAETTNGN